MQVYTELWCDVSVCRCREFSSGDEHDQQCYRHCHDEHSNETALLENLGRLLNDVKACSRSDPLHGLVVVPTCIAMHFHVSMHNALSRVIGLPEMLSVQSLSHGIRL